MLHGSSWVYDTEPKHSFPLVFGRRDEGLAGFELFIAPPAVVDRRPVFAPKYTNRQILFCHQLEVWVLLYTNRSLCRHGKCLLDGFCIGLRTMSREAKPEGQTTSTSRQVVCVVCRVPNTVVYNL